MAVRSLRLLGAPAEEEEDIVDQQICRLCLTQFAKYTCPRCNIRYCSLACYKCDKHAQCSETFYRECFMTELKQKRGSAEEKRHMLDILKRLDEEHTSSSSLGIGEEGDGGCELPLEERLAGLDLDGGDPSELWTRLTTSERRDFQELLSSGKAGHLLPDHTPWWEEPARLVTPLGGEGGGEATPTTATPPVLDNLAPLHSLVKGGAVSPHLHYSVLNVLYGYASAVRLYGGDHRELYLEASQTVLDISSCLSSSSTSFVMASDALHHARLAAVENSIDFSTTVLKDVSCILCHPKSHDCHVINALSDLYEVLSLARQKVKAGQSEVGGAVGVAKRLWLARKKVYFFTAWSVEHEDELCALARLVQLEYDTLAEEFTAQRRANSVLGPPTGIPGQNLDTSPHKLIEELR